jgi:hypothetical protein
MKNQEKNYSWIFFQKNGNMSKKVEIAEKESINIENGQNE